MSTSAAAAAPQEQGFFSSLLSSVFTTAHAEEEDNDQEVAESTDDAEPAEEEEEEEEPEDIAPAIREQCANTKECAPAKSHFEHCEKKVRGGQGWEHEDCVEELFHLMHCVDKCSIPQIWAKLA